jgi:hypothetical protein
VDIDLTYLQRDARDEALTNIGAALERIAARIEATMPGMIVTRLVDKQGKPAEVCTSGWIFKPGDLGGLSSCLLMNPGL